MIFYEEEGEERKSGKWPLSRSLGQIFFSQLPFLSLPPLAACDLVEGFPVQMGGGGGGREREKIVARFFFALATFLKHLRHAH